MTDFLPMIALGVGVLFNIAAIVIVQRTPGPITPSTRRSVIAASVLLIVAPVALFAVVDGDPDVWDFYRSLWFAPLIILGGLSAWLIVAANRQSARASETNRA